MKGEGEGRGKGKGNGIGKEWEGGRVGWERGKMAQCELLVQFVTKAKYNVWVKNAKLTWPMQSRLASPRSQRFLMCLILVTVS